MMFDLILDVMNGFWQLRDAHTESAITLSPRDRFNRPAGTGLFSSASRHFVPGYYRAVPPGQKPSPIEVHRIILALMGLKPWAKSFGPFGAIKHSKSVLTSVIA
jgi:hypothetical protein